MVQHAPPPTKFGPSPVGQPKPAHGRTAPAQGRASGPAVRPAAITPPATKFGPAQVGQPKAAHTRTAPPQPKAVMPARALAVQRMEEVNPYDDLIGIGDQNFRSEYHFTDHDFGEGAGYYTAAVAKVNGYVFGKYYSGSAGHAEHQALNELYKVTFAARQGMQMFLDQPRVNKLTIYVSKSPCSSDFQTNPDGLGCTEKILGNRTINGFDFQVKVRYGNLYVPKGINSTFKQGPKERSQMAVTYMNKSQVDTKPYDTDTKKVKGVTGHRSDPHPFRFIS